MMYESIKYIEYLIDYVNPTKGVYIAIDGPVCCAKMKQQRQRRFRSIHDKYVFDRLKKKYNKSIPYYWNNSAISPGTKFMEKLNNKIIEWIENYKKKNNITIIYSSSNIPGEGEHKLLDYIKENKSNNLFWCIYGLDADLIMLSLVAKTNKIYLLREAQQFEKKASENQLNFVSIKQLKLCIVETFKHKINTIINTDRLINDFIFLCYFLGNDFLPHILTLDIAKHGIEYLISIYCDIYNIKKEYILSENTLIINQDFLIIFLQKLSKDEESILIKNFSNIKKTRYFGFNMNKYEKELFKIDNLLFKIEDPIGIGINSDYRNNYYKYYYDVDDDELEDFVKKLVKNYLITIRWVTYYYFQTIPDWLWYYSYDHPPFLSDIAQYIIDMNSIQFKKNTVLTSFEQLLIILPSQANYLLPNNFKKLVLNNNSSLAHLYPLDFTIDFLYKRKYWEGIPLLPPLEIKLIKHIYNKYKDELSNDEIIRNTVTDIIIK